MKKRSETDVTVVTDAHASPAEAPGDPEPALELVNTSERELDAILAPEDLARMSRELVNLLGEIGEEEEEQAAEKAAMKERLANMNARLAKLAGTIRRGIEKRTVEVQVFADWKTQTAIERRSDTGAELERRPLRESERQMRLQPDVAASAEGAMAEAGEE